MTCLSGQKLSCVSKIPQKFLTHGYLKCDSCYHIGSHQGYGVSCYGFHVFHKHWPVTCLEQREGVVTLYMWLNDNTTLNLSYLNRQWRSFFQRGVLCLFDKKLGNEIKDITEGGKLSCSNP